MLRRDIRRFRFVHGMQAVVKVPRCIPSRCQGDCAPQTSRTGEQVVPTWLVTGGAGFIGGNFVLEAVARGIKVVNLDAADLRRQPEDLSSLDGNPDHVFVQGDIGDSALVARLLAEHQPDAVLNFAAESHVDRSIDGPGASSRPTWSAPGPAGSRARPLEGAAGGAGRGVPLPARVHRRGVRHLGETGKFSETTPYAPTRRIRRRRPRPTIWCARSTTPTGCRC
jgi:dTDP-glucose 4,6-dehydratase